MQALQRIPTATGLNGKSGEDIFCGGVKFSNQAFQRFRQNSQFLEKPRAVREKDVMEEIVPGCCCPSGFTSKELSLQGLDPRNVIEMPSTVREGIARADQFSGELREQISGN